jgi:hypothetical protein
LAGIKILRFLANHAHVLCASVAEALEVAVIVSDTSVYNSRRIVSNFMILVLRARGKKEEEGMRTSIKICTGTKGSFAITRQSGLWWRASESFAIDAGAEELAAVKVRPSLIFVYHICCDH